MIIAIFIALIVLIALILILLLKERSGGLSSKLDASLKEQFLTFQSNLNKELNSTREEIGRSKDLISEHTIKTVDTIKDIGETINKIIYQQEESQKLGQSLKDLLQAPKLRGNYGEAVLEEMLDKVLPKGIWQMQYSIEGQEMVDAVVKIKDIIIPIDAKFPRDDYNRYLETSDKNEKAKYWKAHETAIKNLIKDISEKYIKPEKGTSDFALMFIPSEAIYYETIAEKNYLGSPSDIYEYAQKYKVIPVSPNTFYAFLQMAVVSIRNLKIIKSARQLQKGLVSLQKSFTAFYKKYEEIGKLFNKAVNAYSVGNNHIKRYKNQLDTSLKLEEFKTKKDINSLPKKSK